MPRVSETVSDNELRVPNDASLRMVASMRAAETFETISAMRGFASPGEPIAGPLRAIPSTRRVSTFMN
jgi:hypothetical protein